MPAPALRRRACVVLGAAALLAGCNGRDAAARGRTVIIGTAQDPKTLFPPFAENTQSRALTALIFEHLADRGASLNTVGDAHYVPRLALRWNWSPDSLRLTFHLDPRARWQDDHPVSATDVRFAFEVFTDSLVGSRLREDLIAVVDSISVSDSLTCTAWFRQRSPERFDILVSRLTPLPAHLLRGVRRDSIERSAFARKPIGSGPFKLVSWEPQVRLELAPSASYAGARPALDRVIWTFAPDGSTLTRQFMAGESDFVEGLSVEDAAAVAKTANLRVVGLGSYVYDFLLFNLRDGASVRPHPLFGNHALRRALTMALDRPLLVRSVFDSLGHVGLGPFVRAQWSADTSITEIAFDHSGASRLLDSLGWRIGKDGMRARRGQQLAFTLMVPTSSKARLSFAVLIQEQLRLAGVEVAVAKLDANAMSERLKAHTFDAAMGALNTEPSPGSLNQTWTSAAAKKGGFNFGRYESESFDAAVDRAMKSNSQAAAKAHYRAAYQIIVNDAPAIWLYEPPMLAGVNTRLRIGTLRPDAWWTSIPGWSIR